jgi:hypothetical protein
MQRRSNYLDKLNRKAKKTQKERMKNPHAVALGKKGGIKGGPARASALNKERRVAIARQGGFARHAKYAG